MDSLSSDLGLTSTLRPPASSSSPPSPSSSSSSSPPQSSPPLNSPPPPESEKSNPKSPPPQESTPSPPSPESPLSPEAEPPPPPQESPHSPPPKDGSSTSAAAPPPPPVSLAASPNSPTLPSPSPPQANSVSSLLVTPSPHVVASRKLSPPSSQSIGGLLPLPSSSSENRVIIVGLVLGGFLILASIIIFIKCRSRKKKKNQFYMDPPRGPKPKGLMGTAPCGVGPYPSQGYVSSGDYSSGFSDLQSIGMTPISPNVQLGMNQSSFSYDELAAATGGFSQANMLGQGGFGYVHKGVLADGREVAVKSLKSGSGQGEREFRAEVEIISRVHHRYLVSLVGYCIADGRRMLVYEFVPNKTLEYHLHGSGRPTLDWATRLRIALGSAKGLSYLHEDCHPRIIHRDIKSANILIDYEFEAKVADFGLAKLSNDNNTHISTRIMGTFGYLAPEYASSGKLTEKSDVYSFGVMLLELITGSKPVDNDSSIEDSLLDWARPILSQALEDGTYEGLVDPRLEDNYVPHEMARMVACAAASICNSAKRRPKMSQIVRVLEGDLSPEDLINVTTTGSNTSSHKSRSSSTYDTSAYNADLVKFRKMVLMANQEHKSKV